jgi:phosphomannomutase
VATEDLLLRPSTQATDAVQLTGRTDTGTIRAIARPSGTEPKLKFYLEVTENPGPPLADAKARASSRLAQLTDEVAAISRTEH